MERIGGYGVVRKLGEGGMGTVWLARSRGGRLLAVKVARPELAADPEFRERFRAEVAAARRVGGFHTAQVVDADPDAPAPWLATAYIPGPTLARLVAEQGPLAQEPLRRLGAALAEALQAVHRCGLVHRDLKPGNIVMADDGPRVLDFGIARAVDNTRLTVAGTAFGTPGFLAPEQAEGRDVGPAADVFALGAVLVAAAGGSPFGGGTPVALMYRSVHQEADLSAVPAPLRPMVAACMDKSPLRRPSTDQLLDWFSPADAPADAAPAGVPGVAADAGGAPAGDPGVAADAGGAPAGVPGAAADAGAAPAGDPGAAAGMGGASAGTAPTGAAHPVVAPASPVDRVPAVPPMPGYAPAPYAGHPLPAAALPPSPYAPTGYGYPAPTTPGYAVTPPAPRPPLEGPEFLAMDRRNAVVADPYGISLGVNGRVAEFPWAGIEVAWCERGAGRGHVLVVAVALHDGSVHSCDVSTRQAAELLAWEAQFNALLAYYSRPES